MGLDSRVDSTRDNNISIMRFIAAALVIYGHMFVLSVHQQPNLLLGNQPHIIGIRIFFVISGYLITKSFNSDRNVLRYALRRFFRIVPGLVFCIILTTFIIGPILTTLPLDKYYTDPEVYGYLFKNILFSPVFNLPGVFENNPSSAVNGSIWSLPVEIIMYIIFPIVFWLCSKSRYQTVLLTICVIAVCILNVIWSIYYPTDILVVYGTPFKNVSDLAPFFFMSGLFTLPFYKKLLNIQVGFILLVIAQLLSLSNWKMDIVQFVVFPYAILSFAFDSKPVFKDFSVKNDYSYGLFLFGFVSEQSIIKYLLIDNTIVENRNVLFVISILLALGFAVMSWHLVEKPMQKIGRRMISFVP